MNEFKYRDISAIFFLNPEEEPKPHRGLPLYTEKVIQGISAMWAEESESPWACLSPLGESRGGQQG